MLMLLISFIAYAALLYYAFKNYSPLKGFLIASASMVTISGAYATLVQPAPKTTIPSRNSSSYSYSNVAQIIQKTNLIKQNEIELSNIQMKQWSKDNYLWILTGNLLNKSEFTLNNLELELIFSDCRNTSEKSICVSKNIPLKISDLNIKSHENKQFETTYTIDDRTPTQRVNTLFKAASSIVKEPPPIDYGMRQSVPQNLRVKFSDKNIDLKEDNIDRTVVCGHCGETARIDEEKYDFCNGTYFRWPARGRIIRAFANGGDGINIALSEGTQIKAAEGGEVIYSGSELSNYGNMILIRHFNGFISSYANSDELLVFRGDRVHRGQTIALSGKTGEAKSPQLHFELRKGSQPVDPMRCLAGPLVPDGIISGSPQNRL